MPKVNNFVQILIIYSSIMTILQFAQARNLDWQDIYSYLQGSGFEGVQHPETLVDKEWLSELRKQFPLSEGNSEVEQDDLPSDLDERTQKLIEEEEANKILQNDIIDASQVNIDAKNLTLDIIIRRIENNEIQFDPDFQRSQNLWDNKRQSQLIESILVKLPLPAFYFDATDDNKWIVVDGLQRLSTIRNFVVDKKLKLTGLEFLPNLSDKNYDALPRPIQRRIQETSIFAYLIKPGTPENVKFNIFRRINTGGLMLSPQEIRHALNQGVPAETIKEMAGNEAFKQATGYSLSNNNRMEDRDYVNRFVAFYLNDYKNYERGENGLDGLLNEAMSQINKENASQIKSDFSKAMRAAFQIFEWDTFRKRYDIERASRRKPLNKALFEVWSVHLSKLDDNQLTRLINNRTTVIQDTIRLLNEDKYFDVCVTYGTGDSKRVRYRFEAVNNLISNILKSDD